MSDSAAVVIPLAMLIGAGIVALYARSSGLRSLVSILGIAPIAVIVLLLFFSPVNDIVFPAKETTTKAATVASGAAPTTPVVLMIFDELPTMSLMKKDMSVDAQRYPNFARLAKGSTWYRNATSRVRRHVRRGARDPLRPAPAGRAADLALVPAQPVLARRAHVRHPRPGADHPRLPGDAVQGAAVGIAVDPAAVTRP